MLLYLVVPVLISYATYVFVAEQFNPFKSEKEVSRRRRIKKGRKFAAAMLPLCVLAVAAYESLPYWT